MEKTLHKEREDVTTRLKLMQDLKKLKQRGI